MATEVIRYVNTASSGGDGTTNTTSGSTAAYASLSAAIGAEFAARGNLVSADQQLTIKVTGATADSVYINKSDNWTTDSTHYVRVVAEGADRAGPLWSTAKYRYSVSFSGGTPMGKLNAIEHIRFEGVQFENPNTGSNVAGLSFAPANSDGDFRFLACYFRCPNATSSGTGVAVVAAGVTGTKTVVVANCVFEGWGTGIDLTNSTVTASEALYNNTFVDCTTGVDATGTNGTCYVINNLFSGCTTPITGGASGDTNTTNATDVASLGTGLPTGTGNRVSQTFTFTDSANGDYSLASGDAGAKGHGTDLSGDSVYALSVEMDGTARPSTWDIGADQVTTAASGSGSGAYYYRRRRR